MSKRLTIMECIDIMAVDSVKDTKEYLDGDITSETFPSYAETYKLLFLGIFIREVMNGMIPAYIEPNIPERDIPFSDYNLNGVWLFSPIEKCSLWRYVDWKSCEIDEKTFKGWWKMEKHKNTISNKIKYEKVKQKAIWLIQNKSDECIDDRGKIKNESLWEAIKDKSMFLFGTETPPIKKRRFDDIYGSTGIYVAAWSV